MYYFPQFDHIPPRVLDKRETTVYFFQEKGLADGRDIALFEFGQNSIEVVHVKTNMMVTAFSQAFAQIVIFRFRGQLPTREDLYPEILCICPGKVGELFIRIIPFM